ncbi:MAG TPA: hypothetical protein VEK57_18450 [Thermoanaerobaculia bacterium]|nr:hypothetical protein [Thermoanaerobaculia bacterium]
MIVVVETNFLLELVLQQEQSNACVELRTLCAASEDTHLFVPAFAIAEAGTVLERRQGERRKFLDESVPKQVNEIRRSKVLGRYRAILTELRVELLLAEEQETARWVDLQLSLRDQIIPMTADMLIDAISTRIGLNLALPDALVLTSVRHHLAQIRATSDVPALFVSTDLAGFGTPSVTAYLREVGCRYINSFANAVEYLRR